MAHDEELQVLGGVAAASSMSSWIERHNAT
jgi:hypothetical protein